MTNLQRYTRGKFGRIEKHDGGEFCYFINVDEVLNKKEDLIRKLNDNNALLYEQRELALLSCKRYQDRLTELKIITKKYRIIAFVSILINIGLIGSNYL